jgi:hypothetical protein
MERRVPVRVRYGGALFASVALGATVLVAPAVLAEPQSGTRTYVCSGIRNEWRIEATDTPDPVEPGGTVSLAFVGPFTEQGLPNQGTLIVLPLPPELDPATVTATGGFGSLPVKITVTRADVTIRSNLGEGVAVSPTLYTGMLTVTGRVWPSVAGDTITWALPSLSGCSPLPGQEPLNVTRIARTPGTTVASTATTVPRPPERGGVLTRILTRLLCRVLRVC